MLTDPRLEPRGSWRRRFPELLKRERVKKGWRIATHVVTTKKIAHGNTFKPDQVINDPLKERAML